MLFSRTFWQIFTPFFPKNEDKLASKFAPIFYIPRTYFSNYPYFWYFSQQIKYENRRNRNNLYEKFCAKLRNLTVTIKLQLYAKLQFDLYLDIVRFLKITLFFLFRGHKLHPILEISRTFLSADRVEKWPLFPQNWERTCVHIVQVEFRDRDRHVIVGRYHHQRMCGVLEDFAYTMV